MTIGFPGTGIGGEADDCDKARKSTAARNLIADADDPCSWTARELTAAFKSGSLTPLSLLDRLLERCRQINPIINAVVALDEDRARSAAADSTRRWREACPLSPIDGIPVSIKDNMFLAGVASTWGSALYADFVPERDEPPVARLRAAGAVLFAKTNVPEMTVTGHTTNALFGTTFNPLAPGRSAGGSSGGAAAAVAAGLGPIAIGTDGGGSLRRPAAHCGLYALKPSIGQVARYGGFPPTLHDMETVGPMARCLEDVEMAFLALRGFDGRDPRSLAALAEAPRAAASSRIAYFPRFGAAPVDGRIIAAMTAAMNRLADAGYEIETPALPFDFDEISAHWTTIAVVGVASVLSTIDNALDRVNPGLRRMAEDGARVSSADYAKAIASLGRHRSQAVDFFARWSLLISPTMASGAWPAEDGFPAIIDGVAVGPRGHAVFTGWANVIGAAAATLPIGTIPGSGGIGMQVIAPAGADLELLRQLKQIDAILAT